MNYSNVVNHAFYKLQWYTFRNSSIPGQYMCANVGRGLVPITEFNGVKRSVNCFQVIKSGFLGTNNEHDRGGHIPLAP